MFLRAYIRLIIFLRKYITYLLERYKIRYIIKEFL